MTWIPTKRDIAALVLIYRLHFMTIEQTTVAVYGNRNVAQRRLSRLERETYLLSFPLTLGCKGQPTKVYYLNRHAREKLVEILGHEVSWRNIPRAPPENALVSRHTLELNSLLAVFVSAARTNTYHFEVIPECWNSETGNGLLLDDEVRDPRNPLKTLRYRRDAVCCIGTSRGKGLFEIEYDRGNEAIGGSSTRRITVGNKIAVFVESLKEKRFERYCSAAYFNHPFRTSRLLIVTSSRSRVEGIGACCAQLGTRGLVYVTSVEELSPATVFGTIWRVEDSGQFERRPLVGRHE